MQIEVRSSQSSLTDNLSVYAQRRLGFALGGRMSQIRRIFLTLRDINGPKGGVDQQCQILVRVDGQPEIIVEETQEKWPAAVDGAAARLSRILSRRFGRLRHRTRKGSSRTVFVEKAAVSEAG